jgi:tRNA(fMet)-specific endonuclease VapC
VARLILDTGVLVAAFRGRLDFGGFLDGDDVALPAVVIAEYLAGVHLDTDDGRSAAQREFLEDVLGVVPVEDYTPTVAQHHAVLLAEVTRLGAPRGTLDLIIAATARATGRVLVTTDGRARFGDLPGVDERLLTQ